MKLILLASVFLFSSTIQLPEEPEALSKVTIKERIKIVDEEEGYYDRVHSTYSDKGEVVVLDIGNKLVHRYDKDGKHILSFGKEGSGPGELNRPREIFALKDRIIVRDGRSIHLFKNDGSFVKDISENWARPVINEMGIFFNFWTSPRVRFRTKQYNFDGELVKQIKNEAYSKEAAENRDGRRGFDSSRLKEMMSRPRGNVQFAKRFIQYYPGQYHLEILDEKNNSVVHLKRKYTRKKEIQEVLDRRQQRMNSRGGGKERQKRRKQMMAMRDDITGGYQNDIVEIIGTNNDYAFVRTSSDKIGTLEVDVISADFKYTSKFKIEGDEILSASVVKDKLLVNFKNDEEGPYVKVYDVVMN